MYILATNGSTFVNTDRVDCLYLRPKQDKTVSVVARLATTEVELGIYESAEYAGQALLQTVQKILNEPGIVKPVWIMPPEPPKKDEAKMEAVKEPST